MSVRMLANRRRARKINAVKDGGFIKFSREHLDGYLAQHDSKTQLEGGGSEAVAEHSGPTKRERKKFTPEELAERRARWNNRKHVVAKMFADLSRS
jgi:hypothetical protein